jgi:hypothetical protein
MKKKGKRGKLLKDASLSSGDGEFQRNKCSCRMDIENKFKFK